MHRIGQLDTADAIGTGGQQRSTIENVGCEVFENQRMLFQRMLGIFKAVFIDFVFVDLFAHEEVDDIFDRHFTVDFIFGLAQGADGRFFAAFDDNFAFVTQDFEAVGAKQVMGAGDENAAGTIGVFGQGDDIVFDGDVALVAKLELGGHGCRHAADPLPQVELVWCLVDEHATAFATPGSTPGTLVIIGLWTPPGGDHPGRAADVADLTAGDDLLEPLVERIGALVEHHTKGQFRAGGRILEQLGDLLAVNASWFFQQGMDIAFQGLDTHFRMQVMRDGGADRINQATFQKIDVIVKERHIRVFFRTQGLFLGINITQSGELRVADLAGDQEIGIHATLCTDSNDPHSDFFHLEFSFLLGRPAD